MNLQSSTVVNMYFCVECNCYVERGCAIHQLSNEPNSDTRWQKYFNRNVGISIDFDEWVKGFKNINSQKA